MWKYLKRCRCQHLGCVVWFSQTCALKISTIFHLITLATNTFFWCKPKSFGILPFSEKEFRLWIQFSSINLTSYGKFIKFKIVLLKRTHSERDRDGDMLPVARILETNTLKCWQSTVSWIQCKINANADVINVFSCMRSFLAQIWRTS